MDSCSNCGSQFRKRHGGYHRYSLERCIVSTGKPAREHLAELTGSSFTPSEKAIQFLCADCWSKLNKSVRYQTSVENLLKSTSETSYVARKRRSVGEQPSTSFIKRPRFTSTPVKKAAYAMDKTPKCTKWDTIVTAVRARQYSRAIYGLYNATKGSKVKFAEVVKRIVRKEIQCMLRQREEFPLCRDVTVPNISNFSWDKTLDFASDKMPVLYNCLKGAVTTKNNDSTLCRNGNTNLKPRIGSTLALIMNTKDSRHCNFFQTLMSVQFWRGGLKRETLKQISRLGICASYETTLTAIDHIRSDFDSAAIKCRDDIINALSKVNVDSPPHEVDLELSSDLSVSLPNIEDEIVEYPDMTDTILYSDSNDFQSVQNSLYSSDEEVFGSVEPADYSSSDVEETEEKLSSIDEEEELDVIEDFLVEEESVDEAMEQEVGGKDMTDCPDEAKNKTPSFTMCWDNVGKKVVTRHPTETLKNRYMNMALAYIAINRVPSLHLQWKEDRSKKASDIPLIYFIPQESDFKQLRFRMGVLVGRIICRHIKWFHENFTTVTMPHIIHEYTAESTRKSILINLGAFDEDPCSTQGAIGIYERLQRYVPFIGGNPVKTLVFGDGLSCERGNDAQRARCNGISSSERLEGLEPAAQEFHKEMLLLQDFFDVFFKGSSSSDRGTLCQIKNMLNFRQVKTDIGDNFSHAWELMCTVVESFVCLLCQQTTNIQDVTLRPGNAPDNIEDSSDNDKAAYLEEVCKTIVDKIWLQLNTESLKVDDGGAPTIVCCGEDLDEDMIGCECRSSCPRGEFFHYTCADIDPDNLPFPWYCSNECRHRQVQPYNYCVCGEDMGTDVPMIGCHLESACTKREWYHMVCLGIEPKKPPKGNWFCCEECRHISRSKKKIKKKSQQPADDQDRVQGYSLALVWAGLNLLCRRDAVREADGEAMMAHWRLDIVHFFANKHPKYTILAHRLLAAVNGWMPDRIKHDLIHNRTVNYGGGIGRNLPLDFMNEILNRLFKDLLMSAKGRYTDTTVQRYSQIIGPLGEALDTVFDCNVVENEVYRHRRRAQNRDTYVSQLIHILGTENLFDNEAGRKHSAFPDFQYTVDPRRCGRFASKINQLSKRLDSHRQSVINQ